MPTRPRETHILQNLKRLLRPLRPVLLPIWRRVDAAMFAISARIARARARPAEPGAIRPLTESEFYEMAEAFPYYKGRWGYLSAALGEASSIMRKHGVRTALELGAPVRPILVGADVMDIKARPELDPSVNITIHDATQAPWPVADKAYDLFLALQVFEHLRDQQPEAFREVRRVARNAIISLPIDWEMEDPRNCHHQIPEARVLSWFAPVVPTRVIEGNGGKRRRMIYVFENLPA